MGGLKQWVRDLRAYADGPGDGRTIRWLVDPVGGVGKTTFTKLLAVEGRGYLVFGSTKMQNVAMVVGRHLQAGREIKAIVFDITRSQDQRFVSYQALEACSNGMLLADKGCGEEVGVHCWEHTPVIVFSNHSPDESKLSNGRFDISVFNADGTLS